MRLPDVIEFILEFRECSGVQKVGATLRVAAVTPQATSKDAIAAGRADKSSVFIPLQRFQSPSEYAV